MISVPKKSADVLARARTRLVTSHPLFASIVLRYPFTWTRDIPTAAITPRGHIMLNPDFLENLKTQQVVFLLAHEAMHFMGMHAIRRKHRHPGKWNWANDAVINDLLLASDIGEFIDGGVLLPGSKQKNSETVYDEMPDDANGEDNVLTGDILYGSGEGGDGKESPPTQTQSEIQEIEAEVKMAVVQAMNAAKIRGHLIGGDLGRMLDDIIDVRTPWYTILERHFAAFKPDGFSWSKPSRRHLASDLYLPGKDTASILGEVVIAIDTSGSISGKELNHFAGHIKRIVGECEPEKIHVVYCDCRINGFETFESMEEVSFSAKGGGGTAFKPVFDWVEAQGIKPDVLVYLTDLEGNTKFAPPKYPTLWLSTSSTHASFGEVIKYEITQ